MARQYFLGLWLILPLLISCTKKSEPLGSAKNPIKFYFLPSVDANAIADKSDIIKKYLEANTPYKFEIGVPTSYVAVVEAFGTKRSDVATLNTFGYLMANERYGATAALTAIRFGKDTYKAQIIARSDSGIKKIEDLKGKRFAYVDPASTSGYYMAAKLLKDKGITLGETVFAKKHDNVVTMVYQKQVDAGATFYTEPVDGVTQDARRLVKTQFPDVDSKISIIALTDEIPNDPIVFGNHVPQEIQSSIMEALKKLIETPEGKDAFYSLYGITGFKTASDKTYDDVRSMLNSIGKNPAELIK
jgi:phosphonate transport system substrate-binding protein